MIVHIDSRSCRSDEVRAPALAFVKAFRVNVGDFDARQPFDVFLSEISWNDDAQRITVPIRQRNAVHFVSKERSRIQCLLQRNGVGVIINAVQARARGISQRVGWFDQVAQGEAFPIRVAHQSGIEAVADAHESRLLLDGIKSFQIFEAIRRAVLHKAVHFQMPKANIDTRVDNVLCYTIKQYGEDPRLYDAAFVLRAVVAEGGDAKKFAYEGDAASGEDQS